MKYLLCILLTAALLQFSGCRLSESDASTKAASDSASSSFTVTFLDVGKADCIVLQTTQHTIVLDCGEKNDGKDLVEFLEQQEVSQIDYLILTHYDKDHIGGAAKLLKNFDVDQILAPNYTEESDDFTRYSDAVEKQQLTPQLLTETITFTLDDVTFTVQPPQKSDYGEEDDNDFSLAVLASHGSNTFLFTGDAMEQRIEELLKWNPGQVQVLKVPYHGKELSNLSALLNLTQPDIAVVSTNEDTFASETEDLLEDSVGTLYATCYDGQITIQSDGSTLTAETEE